MILICFQNFIQIEMYLKAPKKKTKKYTETNGNLFQLYFLNIHFALHSVLKIKREPERMEGWERIEVGVVYHVCYQYTER